MLQLVTRLVGLHKLSVLSLYSYLLKYLSPRQRDVTHFLVCAAQATHDLVPPDAIEPMVQKIANEFVSEGVAGEVASAGLNAIREICVRAPLAMNATLLQDLTEYKSSKDKGVMMAARSLIGLYREVAPEMLKRRDRGKMTAIGMKDRTELRYGEERSGGIEGLELLEEWKEEQKQLKREASGKTEGDPDQDADGEGDGDEDGDDEDGWDGWEVEEEEEDSDNETGWINVESDDEINISDSDDDKPTPKKKRKTGKSTGSDGSDGEKEEDADTAEKGKNDVTLDKVAKEEKKLSTLATERILTPADFAKLEELRTQAGLEKLLGKKITNRSVPWFPYSLLISFTDTSLLHRHEDAVDEDTIKGPAKRGKAEKEARLAAVEEGRKDRKFGSKRGQKLAEKAHSTTNKEKARKKSMSSSLWLGFFLAIKTGPGLMECAVDFLMTLGKAKSQMKKEKLVETRRRVKAGAEKSKKQKRH